MMKKVPKRRFKGFLNAGDWEQRKLGEAATVEMNKRIFKEQTSSEGEVPFYKIGTFGGAADSYISRDLYEEYKKKYPYPNSGDILISASGSIGRTVVYNGEEAYFQDSNIVWLNHEGRINNSFLLQFYNVVKWSGLEGSTIKRLYNKNILETPILLPKLEEQQLIGGFLKLVDDNITLHQRKLEKLQATKKALLYELFPIENSRRPKRRFKGFTDDWEQRKLIYIFSDFIVPMRDKPKVFSGTTPWTRIEDIEGRYINTSLSGQFVSDETIKSMNLKVIPKGSLIVSASATFGVVAIVNNDLITNQTFIGLVPNKDFDIDFLYFLFEAPTTKDKLLKLSAGSTIFYIARESFENLVLSVPSKAEQMKISKIFKSIDDSITLHQRKLEKLKNLKAAYLNEMFV